MVDSTIPAGASASRTATDHSATEIMTAPGSRIALPWSSLAPCAWRLQPDAAAAAARRRALADQLDAGNRERVDQLHQGIDIAADDAFGALHALDRRQRQGAELREFALVDPQQSAGGPKLR